MYSHIYAGDSKYVVETVVYEHLAGFWMIDENSVVISISNGVKQGGCLSRTLFSMDLNDLIDVLRSSNIGCRYGNHYMDVYCYVDDIGLLSPTLSGLK